MSASQPQGPSGPPPAMMVTSHHIDHPHALSRRIKTGLTFVGAAAAVLALAAGSPSANADPAIVDFPDFPTTTGLQIAPEATGIAPFFAGEAYEQNGSYTDLFNEVVNTNAPSYLGNPLLVDDYEFPGVAPSSFEVLQYANPGFAYGIDGNGLNGSVDGSTFSVVATNSGLYNFFEETPYFANATQTTTDSINDVLAYDPTGIPLGGLSGIEFGIQYLDLPFAATPVDEINLLGAGGEILASMPVTGDLASLF